MNEPKVLADLHKIRENHFVENRDATHSEFLKKMKDETAALKQRILKKDTSVITR